MGLDEIMRGGLPRGRTTLLEGGAGCGKTVLALQTLVHSARELSEPGIFVAFEESSTRILANAASFGWDLASLQSKNLFFLDAQPSPELLVSGDFDLSGMLAGLDARVKSLGAKRIVFDALDIILSLLSDDLVRRREVNRIHEWLLARELTAMITLKSSDGLKVARQLDFLQFMVDCAIVLKSDVVQGTSQRSLRVIKCRGSSFDENEAPFVIGAQGIEVASTFSHSNYEIVVSDERVSSGVERLDSMLGGGYFRGASVLITGSPGTAKTTLSGAFAQAACERGERTLFVTFDSHGDEIVRNLASVDIQLKPFVGNLLQMHSARAIGGNAEIHLMRIKHLAEEFGARCLIVDPISALAKSGNADLSHSVIERLVDWSKKKGITLICTSLVDHTLFQGEGSPVQISTIADTWIKLNYVVHAGERNRGLSIIKSRGTEHSNQVRELVLSKDGISLTDVYHAGGEVLMGSMRFEKERANMLAQRRREADNEQVRIEIDAAVLELEMKLLVIQREIALKRAEKLNRALYAEAQAEDEAFADAMLWQRRGGNDESGGKDDNEP
ncbi:MAG: circadian clock protein KaiC [Bradymonadaceae bacterium]|nr:circadian clock protein KaiC [Lujinxingiaceae bacterium]